METLSLTHLLIDSVSVCGRYVVVVVEAFDLLLATCHSQSLNLFVESFLKMVQKLLECNEPDMQCLAVDAVSASDVALIFLQFVILTQPSQLSISCYLHTSYSKAPASLSDSECHRIPSLRHHFFEA